MCEQEREAFKEHMMGRIAILRAMVHDLIDRFEAALGSNHSHAAKRYVEALRRLGAANRGSEVMLIIDMLGNAFEKRAAMMQESLDRRIVSSGGSK